MLVDQRVLVFLGPPGSGKGTQSAKLSQVLQIPAISTGEILRHECQSGSELGRTVHAVMTSGGLVSDDLMNQVVAPRLEQRDCEVGCILDGYPRTVSQARFLRDFLERLGMPQPTVLDFAVSAKEIVTRLSRRRQCVECGNIFSLGAGMDALRCDLDGSALIPRADDHPRAIRARLNLYNRNARQLRGYYRRQDYHRIDAAQSPDRVLHDVLIALGGAGRYPVQKIAPALRATAAY